ncbi:hypothetical protein PV326_005381 [Microctonus aethiopoides]|nr:hypothetical protein PV326_005381 [Microctonus aethiopoides]
MVVFHETWLGEYEQISSPNFNCSMKKIQYEKNHVRSGRKIVNMGVYMSPNPHINNIIAFLHGSLLRYILDGGKVFPQRDDFKLLILTGDFNVNFALDTSIKLIDFT